MQEHTSPAVFKPYTYIEVLKPLAEDPDKNRFSISTIVKAPIGYKPSKNKIVYNNNGKVEKILIVFRKTKKSWDGEVARKEFFFQHFLKASEIRAFNEGIPVQVVAPHDPAGRPIFHDGTSRPHPGDGD